MTLSLILQNTTQCFIGSFQIVKVMPYKNLVNHSRSFSSSKNVLYNNDIASIPPRSTAAIHITSKKQCIMQTYKTKTDENL